MIKNENDWPSGNPPGSIFVYFEIMKNLVREGYNKVAKEYSSNRDQSRINIFTFLTPGVR